MNSNNINKLSNNAKNFIEFYLNHSNYEKSITVKSDYGVFEPIELKYLENVKEILEKLKTKGNIDDYSFEKIDDKKVKFIFE